MPKKGSAERVAMQMTKVIQKKDIQEKLLDHRTTPPFLTVMILGCSVPQTVSLYTMIWNDLLSDNTFLMFDITYGWIALLVTMEGAAA